MIKKIVITLFQLLLICFLALMARETWKAWQDEQLAVVFEKDGRLQQVDVATVSAEKKIWTDYISNSKYISFSYQHKPYNLRFVQDSAWVSEGSRVWLLYSRILDQFRQPGLHYRSDPVLPASKLVNWTIVGTFSFSNKWLFFTVALGFLVVLMACSLLAKLTGSRMLSTLSSWLTIVCFISGGLFVTWDVWARYRYYQQLKTNAIQLSVPLLDKHQGRLPGQKSHIIESYHYTAEISYHQSRRTIAISGGDYDKFSTGDQLPVLYNESMDDMMSADYTLGYWRILLIPLTWIIIIFILRKQHR